MQAFFGFYMVNRGQKALVLFTVDQNVGLGIAFLLHAATFLPVTLTGFYFFSERELKTYCCKFI